MNYFTGDQTQHVLWRILNGEVTGLNPRLIVLKIGTNNLGEMEQYLEINRIDNLQIIFWYIFEIQPQLQYQTLPMAF